MLTPAVALAQVSLYWLILIKLQQNIQMLMLPNDQLLNWSITVILAVVGQAVGLLNMLWQQIKCVARRWPLLMPLTLDTAAATPYARPLLTHSTVAHCVYVTSPYMLG